MWTYTDPNLLQVGTMAIHFTLGNRFHVDYVDIMPLAETYTHGLNFEVETSRRVLHSGNICVCLLDMLTLVKSRWLSVE